jgi:hypothetical protein
MPVLNNKRFIRRRIIYALTLRIALLLYEYVDKIKGMEYRRIPLCQLRVYAIHYTVYAL